MAIYQLDTLIPDIAPDAWVIKNASVIGHVTGRPLQRGSAPLRDNGRRGTTQDGAVLHTTGRPLHIGDSVTVGHRAMLHSCTIGERSLVGPARGGSERRGHRARVLIGSALFPSKVFPDRCLVGAARWCAS
jgi:carbonic anhydrase/acetyltransferase-like protein (isoleucine patch superfamily)